MEINGTVQQVSRTSVVITGLPGAGKKTLFNKLMKQSVPQPDGCPTIPLDAEQSFCLYMKPEFPLTYSNSNKDMEDRFGVKIRIIVVRSSNTDGLCSVSCLLVNNLNKIGKYMNSSNNVHYLLILNTDVNKDKVITTADAEEYAEENDLFYLHYDLSSDGPLVCQVIRNKLAEIAEKARNTPSQRNAHRQPPRMTSNVKTDGDCELI